jgi:DNA-directed RNA polymerase subunit RPC12/RpoP
VTSGAVAEGGQTISFTCSNCGATTNAVALGTSIRCPFCGSEHVITAAKSPDLPSVDSLVPFEIPDDRVNALYRKWLGEGFFRPRDIAEKSSTHQMRAVFVPIWSCSGSAQSHWSASAGYNRSQQESYTRTGDDGKTVQDTRTVTVTDWRPAAGDHQEDYDRLLISASKGLPQDWIKRLGGIDWQKEITYDDQYLFGREAETPSLDRGQAFGFAETEIKDREPRLAARSFPVTPSAISMSTPRSGTWRARCSTCRCGSAVSNTTRRSTAASSTVKLASAAAKPRSQRAG